MVTLDRAALSRNSSNFPGLGLDAEVADNACKELKRLVPSKNQISSAPSMKSSSILHSLVEIMQIEENVLWSRSESSLVVSPR